MAYRTTKNFLIGIVSAAALLNPFQETNAQQTNNNHPSLTENIKAGHNLLDMVTGIPVADIEKHINDYHNGIDYISTKQLRWEGKFVRFYRTLDGCIFACPGESEKEFIPDSKNPRYVLIKNATEKNPFIKTR